jgi:hypothetical protein
MRCSPPGLRPVRYAYAPPSVEKLLGALPVVAEFCRRLDLAAIVDRACPVREVARVTHGQVIEALVANRLTSPRPLLRVQDWARQWAVEEVFGVAPDALNDDRIGRALDAMAPELDQVIGSVGVRAIATFGVDVARLHWDMTSISLYGSYEDPEAGFAQPRWGKPKDRRLDLKQVQTGVAVSGDGGVPVWHRAYDGGAGEVAQVVGAMTHLKELAAEHELLLVGDSKLISRGNILAMNTARVGFVGPPPRPTCPPPSWLPWRLGRPPRSITWPSGTRAPRPSGGAATGSWRVASPWPAGVRPTPTCPSAVCSSGPRRAPRPPPPAGPRSWTARGRSCSGSSVALAAPTTAPRPGVAERVAAIAATRKVTASLHAEVGTDPATGKPTLSWSFDQAALDAEAATDGWYGLLTNLTVEQADAAEVLRRYKGQEVIERRYGAFKGPLGVAPMFLKTNRRITALVSVICLALLVFCLVERAVRKAIAPAIELPGLYVGRPAKPTGRLVFEALAFLRLNPATGPDPPTIPTPAPLPAKLLELLNVDPTHPHWTS